MKINDIAIHLESLAPLSFQEEYDNSGLLIGDPDTECTKAMLCLDVTLPVLKEAVSKGCNLVIGHHPMIFKGIKKLTSRQPVSQLISFALKNDVSVYAIHTNLDNILHGLNDYLLRMLGVGKCSILSTKAGILVKIIVYCPADHAEPVRSAMFAAGAGKIGNYDSCSFNLMGHGTFRASDDANPYVGRKGELHTEPEVRVEVIAPEYLLSSILQQMIRAHPYEEVAYDVVPLRNPAPEVGAGLIGWLENPADEAEFLRKVKERLNLDVIRHSRLRSRPVEKVAICTGSGSFLINDAMKAGADVFLTADLKYHDFFDLNERMIIADIGHYESEHWVKEWLHAVLTEKFPNFAFLISEAETNPVNYLI